MMQIRSGCKKLHTFRSRVEHMTALNNVIVVVLENGKMYRSNAKVTRWYKIKL